jgi:hypothetical protein
MSIEPEDSMLEEALRRDLPSPDVEARLRRRLLAAGVVMSNGIATTAAASGAATSSASATGTLAKAVGMSWGIKLGLTAAVAIPTLGLWLDRDAAPQDPASPPTVASVRAAEPKAAAPSPARPAERGVAPEPVEAVAPEHGLGRPERPVVEAPARTEAVTLPLRPSQSDFGAAPAAPTAPPPSPSTLGDESRLLDGAFAALAAGSLARAAALIAEHEAHYPRGLLTKERERAKTRLTELSRGE